MGISARLQEPRALGLSASQIGVATTLYALGTRDGAIVRFRTGKRRVRGDMSEDVEIESDLEEIVRVLSDQGPLTRRELRNSVQSRLGDPDQFPRALRLAVRRGLVLRQGSRYASAMGEG